MSIQKALMSGVFAVGLLAGGVGVAGAAEDGHDHGHVAAMELQLNNGAKWPTDPPLMHAMDNIRGEIQALLPEIHHDTLAPAGYAVLADAVEENIHYMVENCELPPAADEQLHIVIGRLLEAAEGMRSGAGRAGAVTAVKALNAYGEHFEHADWRPLGG